MHTQRAWSRILGLGVAWLLGGCGGGQEGSSPDRVPADMAVADAGTDAGVMGPVFGPCLTNIDCGGGTLCLDILSRVPLGQGYCSLECVTDADCDPHERADGATWSCLSVTGQSRCMRTCRDGFGCPETDVCLDDFDFNIGIADVCYDLSNDFCTSDSDCLADQHCDFVVADRERLFSACFIPRNPAGVPRPQLLRAGERCDPRSMTLRPEAQPCTRNVHCPETWSCAPRSTDGRKVCTPPDEETCARECLPEGLCDGLCGTDDDCPATMRCSALTYGFPSGLAGGVDDVFSTVGLCTYAQGSRAPCTTDRDCLGTGLPGAGEICLHTSNTDGALDPICVVRPADYVVGGQECGDDPSTPEVEVRFCNGTCGSDGLCAAPCGTRADCAGGRSCEPAFVSVTGMTSRFCEPPEECTTNADCVGDEVCRYVIGANRAYGTCAPPLGMRTVGDACDPTATPQFTPPSERCDHLCLEDGGRSGRCSAACEANGGTCPSSFVCSSRARIIGSGGTPLEPGDDLALPGTALCIYAPGSQTACASSADCPDGESCALGPDSFGRLTGWCMSDVPYGAELGQTCSPTAPCRNRYGCFPRFFELGSHFCTRACTRDADCVEAGLVCRRVMESMKTRSGWPTLCVEPGDPRALPLQ